MYHMAHQSKFSKDRWLKTQFRVNINSVIVYENLMGENPLQDELKSR